MHSKFIGGGLKENRRELDFYPTPFDATFALLDFLRLEPILIREICCGTGDISRVLKTHGHNVISTDIRFTGYGEGGVDFLESIPVKSDAIITNPPFNIADKIIVKALKEADIVCMLLKCQYWHAKKRTRLFNENKPSYILPLNWRPDFNGGGASMMDVSWTVWIKGDTSARYQPLERVDYSCLF